MLSPVTAAGPPVPVVPGWATWPPRPVPAARQQLSCQGVSEGLWTGSVCAAHSPCFLTVSICFEKHLAPRAPALFFIPSVLTQLLDTPVCLFPAVALRPLGRLLLFLPTLAALWSFPGRAHVSHSEQVWQKKPIFQPFLTVALKEVS